MKSTKWHVSRAIRNSLALVGAVFSMTLPRAANADDERYRVEVHAPAHLPNCNDPGGLREELVLALKQPLLEPPASRVLDVRIDHRPSGGEYAVTVTFTDLEGHALDSFTHTYPGSMECFKVLHKIALLAAIEMEKHFAQEKPQPPLAPPSAPPAAPLTPASSPPLQCPVCEKPRPAPSKSASAERRGFLGAGGFASLGTAPTTLVGLQLAGGFRAFRSLWFDFALRGTFPATALPLDWTPVRVHSVLSVAVAPCYRIGAFGACIVGIFGNLWIERLTPTRSSIDTAEFVGIGPRVLLETRIVGRWSLRVDAEVVVPLVPVPLDDDVQARWLSWPITGGASLSFLASF